MNMLRMFRFTLFLGIILIAFPGCQDPCEDTNCVNGGVCFDGDCDCPIGFSGVDCRNETRSDFIGTYLLTGECEEPGSSFISISRNPNRGDYIYIDNIANADIRLTATVSGNEMEINEQTFLDGTITGFGSFNNDQLLMNYTFVNDTANVICSATGVKQ